MQGISGSDEDKIIPMRGDVILRKTYRVETFIIPKTNTVYRSTEMLDLVESQSDENFEPDSCDAQTVMNDKLKERLSQRKEIIKYQETELLSESPKSRNSAEELEFGAANFCGKSEFDADCETKGEEFIGNTEPESLCNESGLDSEEKLCHLDVPDFKGVCESEEEDPFLRFDYSNSNIERSRSYDFLPSLKSGSDLKSIMESSCEVFQGYGSCEKICHHGNKNGCTVAAQSPNQVSEEIFKENWMQRLEFLRRRLSLIREKEVVLQERERLLLKKEKELRILERLVREKIQRADLYLKRCARSSQLILDDDPSLRLISEPRPSPPPYPEKPGTMEGSERSTDLDSREASASSRTSNRSSRSKGSSGNSTRSELSSKGVKEVGETGNGKYLESGKNPVAISGSNGHFSSNDIRFESRYTNSSSLRTSADADIRRSKWSAYGSWKCRTRPKICYDDLDSTLSADIGDSSFAVTSKKLDPRLVRKPLGFARSASERRPKDRPRSLDLDIDRDLESERVLRRISENISAAVQSQGTRFQNYGSIDEGRRAADFKPATGDVPQEKESCPRIQSLDIKSNAAGKDQLKSRKERSNFWNEEASDWLRKKRQAYNLATKRMANRDYENDKENSRKPAKYQTSDKLLQKLKDEKGKKFTIFR